MSFGIYLVVDVTENALANSETESLSENGTERAETTKGGEGLVLFRLNKNWNYFCKKGKKLLKVELTNLGEFSITHDLKVTEETNLQVSQRFLQTL